MSEVQTRTPASRGRVSARGGRGGYSSRGGRGGRSANSSDNVAAFEEEGEIGQMKKKYASTLPMLKELFSDWSDEDLVFALEDADGELEEAIERITEGNVSQWGEVKKKSTDRNRAKAKEVQNVPIETPTAPVRGGRGRAGFESRGRARGDRGGRGGRSGRGGAPTNGSRGAEKPAVVPTVAITAGTATWSSVAEGTASKTGKPSEEQPAAAATPEPVNDPKDTAPKSSVIPEGTKKGWASLFAKPTPPPQPKPAAAPSAAPPVSSQEPPAEPAAEQQKAPEPEPEPEPETTPAAPAATAPTPAPAPVEKAPEPAIPPAIPKIAPPSAATPTAPTTTTTTDAATPVASTSDVTPVQDDLTKTNLEQIPDASHPAPTATAASVVGSALDQNNNATPSRGTPSMYPASTVKSGRAPGFQRRVMEQQEAVVMPGNHAVDRAAVQFGSMGLNGDAAPVDVDETREEAETRAQPPQHSPVAPRASLPPSTQPQGPTETPTVSRPAPGLPPVPQATAGDAFADFARYTDAHKPYDPFSHQVTQPQPQIQEPFANQAPIQPTVTTGSEYSPFYAADQRLPYNYYGAYGQSQDATVAQRAAAGFGVSGAEVQPHIPTTQPPSRYGHVDAPNSGHTTPNPTLPGAAQTPTAQHMPGQSAAAAAAAHAYGAYGYPYYSNPHYAAYMNQMTQHQYGRNRPMYDDARRYDDHYMPHSTQFGYGSQYGPYSKAGMYGQPHAFSYDHASSPATAASFNQAMPGRDSVYGRAGSAQPSEAQQTAAGANAFGTGMDVFGRTPGFGQSQPITQQPPVTAEETKSFDASKAGGPSPSLAQANRPGSATNNVPGQPQAQTGLPPLQAQQGQQGFGTYPQLNPQYGGLGGLGGHQGANQAAAGYGNYGGAGFANYYGNTGRGWGGNYGH